LDEIGEMPLHLQAKLLRVLQDYEVQPLGSERPLWVDIRVIASTNQNLEDLVENGHFRKDLYYRLSVVMLTLPPLRKHKEDIPATSHRFIELYQQKIGKDVTGVTEAAMKSLCRYDWPGNVRELMNVIERAMLLCQTEKISLKDLPYAFHEPMPFSKGIVHPDEMMMTNWKNKTLPEVCREVVDQTERLYLEMVLKESRGRIGRAAKIAGIHTRALYNKMKRLGLQKESFKKKNYPGI
jgi:transcriptional regulator with PAS, ATPase and Fis domain